MSSLVPLELWQDNVILVKKDVFMSLVALQQISLHLLFKKGICTISLVCSVLAHSLLLGWTGCYYLYLFSILEHQGTIVQQTLHPQTKTAAPLPKKNVKYKPADSCMGRSRLTAPELSRPLQWWV